jgi:hypothetical protein
MIHRELGRGNEILNDSSGIGIFFSRIKLSIPLQSFQYHFPIPVEELIIIPNSKLESPNIPILHYSNIPLPYSPSTILNHYT